MTSRGDHGRIEPRRASISHHVRWLASDRRDPDDPRFPRLAAIGMIEATAETTGSTTTERRYSLCSAALAPVRLAEAVRGHWGIDNGLHRVLDVIVKQDRSRLRRGHGAHNTAIVRHFVINLVRPGKAKRSIETMRKAAGWHLAKLARISIHHRVSLIALHWPDARPEQHV